MSKPYIGAGAKFLLLTAFALVALQMQSSVSQAASCDKTLEVKPYTMTPNGNQFTCSTYVGDPPVQQFWECYENYWVVPAHQACKKSSSETGKCCEVREVDATYHLGVCGHAQYVCNVGNPANPPPGVQVKYWVGILHNCAGEEPHASCTE